VERARKLHKRAISDKVRGSDDGQENSQFWTDHCTAKELHVEFSAAGIIQSLTVRWWRRQSIVDCFPGRHPGDYWKTSRGLKLHDSKIRVLELYGAPDSIGPSTLDGREVELLFYSFDWAGPDVPQVMEVTIERGRVVQILLAAQSL